MSGEPSTERLRDEWLGRLSDLIEQVRNWAEQLDWSTRIIEITLEDSQLGRYQAPALLLQEDAVRILLEPIARSAPGADGVVDLYLMPAYDDIASLYLYGNGWHVHYLSSEDASVGTLRDAEAKPLTRETLQDVLEAMKLNAA